MMKEKYESLSAVELKAIAKARGLKNLSGLKKSEVVTRMLEADNIRRDGRTCTDTDRKSGKTRDDRACREIRKASGRENRTGFFTA